MKLYAEERKFDWTFGILNTLFCFIVLCLDQQEKNAMGAAASALRQKQQKTSITNAGITASGGASKAKKKPASDGASRVTKQKKPTQPTESLTKQDYPGQEPEENSIIPRKRAAGDIMPVHDSEDKGNSSPESTTDGGARATAKVDEIISGWKGKLNPVEGFGCKHCSMQQMIFLDNKAFFLSWRTDSHSFFYETKCGKCGVPSKDLDWNKNKTKAMNNIILYCNYGVSSVHVETDGFCPWFCVPCGLKAQEEESKERDRLQIAHGNPCKRSRREGSRRGRYSED